MVLIRVSNIKTISINNLHKRVKHYNNQNKYQIDIARIQARTQVENKA